MSEGKTPEKQHSTQQSATIEKLHKLFAQINPQEVETFYQGFQVWYAQQKAEKLRAQIAELRTQLAANTARMQQFQPSAIALSALAQLQGHNVTSIELLEHMMAKGDEWLNHTMQLLARCEELDVIQGDYTKWCENALEGAYDWIDTMDQANTESTTPTTFDEATETLLLQKLLSDDEEQHVELAEEISTEQETSEQAEEAESIAPVTTVPTIESVEEVDTIAPVTTVEAVESVENSSQVKKAADLEEVISPQQEQTTSHEAVEEQEEVALAPLSTETDILDLPQEELQVHNEESITTDQDEVQDSTEVEQDTEDVTTNVEIAEPMAVVEEPQEINELEVQPEEVIEEQLAAQSEEETTSVADQTVSVENEAEKEIIPFVDSSEFETVEQTLDLLYTLEEEAIAVPDQPVGSVSEATEVYTPVADQVVDEDKEAEEGVVAAVEQTVSEPAEYAEAPAVVENQPAELAPVADTEPATIAQSVEQVAEPAIVTEEREDAQETSEQQVEETAHKQARITQPLASHAQAKITQPLELPEEKTDFFDDEDREEPAQTEEERIATIATIDTAEIPAIARVEQAEIEQLDSAENETTTTADNTEPSAEEIEENEAEPAEKSERAIQLQEAISPETPLPEEDITLHLLPKAMPLHLEEEHTEHMPALVRAYMLYSLEQQALQEEKDEEEECKLPTPLAHAEVIPDEQEEEQEIPSSPAHAEMVVDYQEEEHSEQQEPVQETTQPYEQILFDVLEDDLLPAPTTPQPANLTPVTPIFYDHEPAQVHIAREVETPLPKKKRGFLARLTSKLHR